MSFIVGMLSADEVQKGRSLFAEKIGTEVAAKRLHPHRRRPAQGRPGHGARGRRRRADADDAAHRRRRAQDLSLRLLLRQEGQDQVDREPLAGRLRLGRGHRAPRTSTSSRATPQPEEIIAGIDRGFYLTVAIGLFAGIDSASGDFSIPSAGFMIEKGKITFPVRGISIGGNLFELLKAVDKVGSDLTWFQAVGSPTVLGQATSRSAAPASRSHERVIPRTNGFSHIRARPGGDGAHRR